MEDLVALDNEQAETMQRMAGYWRYANRRTYNQMVKNNELWDWATGAKLPEIEEESELESIEEEDEDAAEGYMLGSTPQGVSSPESYDGDFARPDDDSPLSLSQRFKRLSVDIDGDRLRTSTQRSFIDNQEDLIDFARDRMDRMYMPKLSSGLNSPLDSPDLTSGSSAASPYSDEDVEAYWDTHGSAFNAPTHPMNNHHKTRSPLAPRRTNTTHSLFDGKPDDRSFRNARLVHDASPPPADTPFNPRQHRRFPPPGTILPQANDIGNRYGHLDNDTPAPCEEKKKTPPRMMKPAVLVIPRQPEIVVEAGWEIQGGNGKKNKRDFPVLVKKAAENARRVDGGDGGSGMNFAGAAKKNL